MAPPQAEGKSDICPDRKRIRGTLRVLFDTGESDFEDRDNRLIFHRKRIYFAKIARIQAHSGGFEVETVALTIQPVNVGLVVVNIDGNDKSVDYCA